MARIHLPGLKLTAARKTLTKPKFSDLLYESQDGAQHTRHSIISTGALLEYCIAAGTALAYKFYSISLVGIGENNLLETHAFALEQLEGDDVASLYLLAPNVSMFESASALQTAANAYANLALNTMKYLTRIKNETLPMS